MHKAAKRLSKKFETLVMHRNLDCASYINSYILVKKTHIKMNHYFTMFTGIFFSDYIIQ